MTHHVITFFSPAANAFGPPPPAPVPRAARTKRGLFRLGVDSAHRQAVRYQTRENATFARDHTLGYAMQFWQDTHHREALLLAPYAFFSQQSRGRRHDEPPHPYRGPFLRDRDRIVHCSAYRRLSGKMQVFTGEMGDYHRTRLTHTYEVASIARTLGRALRLNEDLIEALALLHDVGHPPFGHAGEDALDECLAEEGGFSHNRYALTLVEEIEQRYASFPGINLSYEVLDGQIARIDKSPSAQQPLLEVQVVEAADSVTYNAHDTDDAVKLGLVSLADLAQTSLVRQALANIRRRFTDLDGSLLRKAVVHELIDRQVGDLLARSAQQLQAAAPPSAAAACLLPDLLSPSSELAQEKRELERFLYERVYRHPHLSAVRAQAQQRLRTMFDWFCVDLARLPTRFRLRAESVGPARAVGDYLAGMTDRFCDAQFHKITG